MEAKFLKTICIYHGNCADGFGAAWAVREAIGEDNVKFVVGVHGEGVPQNVDLEGRDVFIVDFSYKREVMEAIASLAKTVTLLDHHVSAEKDLKPLLDSGVIKGQFDMSRSGCMMAWDWFFPDQTPPALLRHIQDRDLWSFKLDNTRAILASVFSQPFEFSVWDKMVGEDLTQLVLEGKAIDRANLKVINAHIDQNAYTAEIDGITVPIVNCPGAWASDAGHIMGVGQPFAASYTEVDGYRKYSLRSEPDGMDVSEIAKEYGGGGHKHASGFTVRESRIL